MLIKKFHKLKRSFYERPTLEVAPDLIGKFIIYHSPLGKLSAKIVEVEAYIGENDPASHAFRGKTERNYLMFGPPGFAYIYFIYGMYHCLNFVTEPEGVPAAVLLRAAEPDEGEHIMRTLSPGKTRYDLLNGPGKFCRAFSLTREQNGLDLTGNQLYLEDRALVVRSIKRTGRVGVKAGNDRPWRFLDMESNATSKAH
ncbi:MAG: DNA-3-methyladenine glycosylase [Candidatus Zixiibacteriota bacterium]